ncbi:MAG: DUF559 domain-containing protein, partial [Acidimicrobiales bacterium]
MPHPPRLKQLARAQLSLVTRDQALAAGVTAAAIVRRLKGGAWERMHAGVYRVETSLPATEEQRLRAAVLAVPGAVISHRSAGWLWGLIKVLPAPIDLTIGHSGPCRPELCLHRTRDWPEIGAVVHRRMPVTNPLRTVVDMASALPPDELLQVARIAAGPGGLVAGQGLVDELARRSRQGVRGTVALRRALAELGYPGIPWSALEREMLVLLRRARLPEPVREHPVMGPAAAGPGGDGNRPGTGHAYRADFAWPEQRVLVEVDGYAVHGTPEALQADLARQNDLIAQGWRVLRYTWADLRDRPRRVATDIQALLDAFFVLV